MGSHGPTASGTGELQRLTDRLGEQLSRSVAIDDPALRLLTHSPHHGAVDQQRLNAILHRRTDTKSTAWAIRHGIDRAAGRVRVPANPATGMFSRICLPLRYQGSLLGYLWILDRDQTLAASELAEADAAAAAAAQVLHGERLQRELERSRERELLRDVLEDDEHIRIAAVRALVAESLIETGSRRVQLIVLDITESADHDGNDGAAELALTRVRQHLPARHSLHLVRPDHAILVVATASPAATVDVAGRLRTAFAEQLLAGEKRGVRVTIGEPGRMQDVHRSYGQAMLAVRVGRLLDLGPVIDWSTLGIYRLLAELPQHLITTDALHPALTELVAADPHGLLLQTLEAFLDLAGDVKATAEQLFVHRATLYHRLGRIEQIGRVSMRNGSDRLALHLGLKLGRLAGLLPPAPAPPLSSSDAGE